MGVTHITGQIFYCECGKHWDDYRNARLCAYAHAKKTGHCVTGEITRAFRYQFEVKRAGIKSGQRVSRKLI